MGVSRGKEKERRMGGYEKVRTHHSPVSVSGMMDFIFQAKYAGLHTPLYVRNVFYLKNVCKGNYLLACLQINIAKTKSQVSYVSLDC